LFLTLVGLATAKVLPFGRKCQNVIGKHKKIRQKRMLLFQKEGI